MTTDERQGAGLRAQWKESERRLYPLATTSPDKYERLVRIARALADDLATVRDETHLTDAWSGHEQLVERSVGSAGVVLGDLPVVDVAGVGFALRDAELRASAHQDEQMRIVAEARAFGEAWATLHETGDLASGLAAPYQSIELHLATGVAIVSSVESNPMTARANHVLTVIRMDPMTAAPTDIEPGIAEIQELDDLESFIGARRALHALVESL